jgi:hypothetical protein
MSWWPRPARRWMLQSAPRPDPPSRVYPHAPHVPQIPPTSP